MDDITGLDHAIKEKSAVERDAYSKIIAYNKSAIEEWLKRSDVDVARVMHVADSYVQVGAKLDGKERAFELYFKDYGTAERKLGINFPCFGTFMSDDKVSVAFCKLLGFFASNMESIEADLVSSEQARELYAAYTTARDELMDLRHRRDCQERDAREAARRAEIERIAAKLVPGAKLRVGWSWDKQPAYDEIARVTPKCIFRQHGYGCRERKEDVINSILTGKWDIAE